MNKEDLRILFLGTTSFAVEHLRFLLAEKYNVVGVVTTPDRPAGRGHKLQGSPVKEFAQGSDLPIFQPEKLRDHEFLKAVKELNPSLGIVIAFRMLPKEVWQMPAMGTVNVHASLLPRWRGAAPINHALMAGDTETGVSLFSLTEGLDEGNILGTRSICLSQHATFGSVHDQLAQEGVLLLRDILEATLFNNELPKGKAQESEENILYAHKLTKENTRIVWERSNKELHNFVRGLSPIPVAWTTLVEGNSPTLSSVYKIFETEIIDDYDIYPTSTFPPGSVLPAPKGRLYVATGQGVLSILSLQAPGKKRLDIAAFLNGLTIPVGARFE